ncbi:hypothetical protein GC173_16725 [bacterium]|nr:hypothetical protein [bacterium]
MTSGRHSGIALGIWAALLILCMIASCFERLEFSKRRDIRPLGGWDENHYFAWSRSLIVDGDLEFRDDFEFLASLRGVSPLSETFREALAHTEPTPTGHFPNKYGVGTAVLGSPGLLLARAAVVMHGSDQVHPQASIYMLGHLLSLVVVGFMGLLGSWFLLRRLSFCERTSTLAVTLVALGTPLWGYIWFWTGMAHAAGFAAIVWFALASHAWWGAVVSGKPMVGLLMRAALMGGALGLAMLVRYPNAVAALLPFSLVVTAWLGAEADVRGRLLRGAVASLPVAAVASIVAFLPQMLAWKAVYGSYLLYSYEGEQIHHVPVHALQVLIGTRNSLLLWSPLVVAAVLGLAVAPRELRGWAVGGGLVLVAFLWIYGSWEAYSLGSSFGMRGFVDASAFWMIGVAGLLRWSEQGKGRRVAILLACALCTAWSIWMLGATRAAVQRMDEPFAGGALVTEAPRIARQLGVDCMRPFRNPSRLYPLMTPDVSRIGAQ